MDNQMSSNCDWGRDPSESDSEMEWEDENVVENKKTSNDPCFNALQILFNASMIIRNKIRSQPVFKTPWPPLAADITNENAEKVVDPVLFNVLAWICGFSDDPQLSNHVTVTDNQHSKLTAVAQDLLFLASHGQNPTPKSIALAMAMRQLTGSSNVLKLLNQFGHCISHEYVLRHETALAQVNVYQ